MNNHHVPLLIEESSPGRRCWRTSGAELDAARTGLPQNELRSEAVAWPEIGELDLVRHFTRLSQKNYAITSEFYPLGSCTMK